MEVRRYLEYLPVPVPYPGTGSGVPHRVTLEYRITGASGYHGIRQVSESRALHVPEEWTVGRGHKDSSAVESKVEGRSGGSRARTTRKEAKPDCRVRRANSETGEGSPRFQQFGSE
ncbi:hypothetical protein N7462_009960 [Penicillium macrosclerotiorum]|uniref:uncharacterized protein n=1 Tax=Penicillium macrosclerotiorum TaxID=303699 RepID=UPI002548BAB9|nr:uncharacterized protein N7462_009960 [Penicillium macrosclerotiorum]KAJ5668890.1 hypothetical protein N7462_009960 [Penicillium macrosclerotiorum]